MLRQVFIPLALLMVLGCAAETTPPPSEGDRVFSVEKAPAPNDGDILGVWEATQPTKSPPLSGTTRFELRIDSLAMAMRCTMDDGSAQPVNVGAKAAATVSKEGITIKTAIERIERIGENAACGVKFSAGVLPKCEASTAEEKRQSCFTFDPGTLKIYQKAGTAPIELKKVAD
jgi:hypothetical protein